MKKICTKCEKEKDLYDFYKKKNGRNGRHSECKFCLRERTKRHDIEHPEQKFLRDRNYRERNRIKYAPDEKLKYIRLDEKSREGFERYANKKMRDTASLILNYGIRIGYIVKKDKCEICDSGIKVEGHHKDYSKPCEVLWICQDCHINVHGRRN